MVQRFIINPADKPSYHHSLNIKVPPC